MKKKLSTILTLVMIAMLTISTADAGGGIKIPSANFSLGSLIVDGFVQGTGPATVTVVLEATGLCNGKEFFGSDLQVLNETERSGTKNSKKPFHLETFNFGGCSNDRDLETEQGFIFWDTAKLSVYAGDTTQCDYQPYCGEGLVSSAITTDNPLLILQEYTCETLQDPYGVTCTLIKNPASNNGGFPICHATGNKKNPYVLLSVNGNGLNGHGKHAGDIIPAPAAGCPN